MHARPRFSHRLRRQFQRRAARRAILDGLSGLVRIAARQRLRMMRDGGADALDAVIAAAGLAAAWPATDHHAIARDSRYVREGKLYV